jgi:epothilone polyketide synthase D
MGRVFATEHADISGGLIDLDEADAASLLKAIVAGDGENQIALRGGERYIARLQSYTRPEVATRKPSHMNSPRLHTAHWTN